MSRLPAVVLGPEGLLHRGAQVGRGVLELFALLYNDFIPDKDHGENTPVPFGAPTNMEDDRHANLPKPGRPFGNAAGPFIEPLHNQT